MTLRQRFLPFTNLKIWNNIEKSKLKFTSPELAVKASELRKINGDYEKIKHKSNPKQQASTDRHR
ncbi:hypothetical protein [Microcoleus sp. herbarium12]|uniref:hypothetical protein n=1 Tax=Microcoleus sp. herbarium12 TaxID=3055437 RepID=UPI002FD0FAE3